MATYPEPLTEANWLEHRKTGIGASEVATILGENPYESAYELWARKTGQLEEKVYSLPMELGHYLEPFIAAKYEAERGGPLEDLGDYTIVRHPDHEWLFCTPDRVAYHSPERTGPVELKAVGGNNGKDFRDGDAPIQYQAQLMIQIACLDAEWGALAALVGNREFVVAEFNRNQKFLDAIMDPLKRFMDCVNDRKPPDIDGSESTARILRVLHPLDDGTTARLSIAGIEAAYQLESAKALIKHAEAEKMEAENILKAEIGDATFGEGKGVKYSWKHQTRKSYTVAESETRVLRKVKGE